MKIKKTVYHRGTAMRVALLHLRQLAFEKKSTEAGNKQQAENLNLITFIKKKCMNPSASGWIKKHFKNFDSEIRTQNYPKEEFYKRLKKTGFIYANSLSTLTYPRRNHLQIDS